MSDYVRASSTFFGDKDALATGQAAKIIKGTEFDTEFNAIAVANATKYDSADRGAASGIAPLDANSEVPAANLNIASAGEATARTGDFLISAGVFDSAWDAPNSRSRSPDCRDGFPFRKPLKRKRESVSVFAPRAGFCAAHVERSEKTFIIDGS